MNKQNERRQFLTLLGIGGLLAAVRTGNAQGHGDTQRRRERPPKHTIIEANSESGDMQEALKTALVQLRQQLHSPTPATKLHWKLTNVEGTIAADGSTPLTVIVEGWLA